MEGRSTKRRVVQRSNLGEQASMLYLWGDDDRHAIAIREIQSLGSIHGEDAYESICISTASAAAISPRVHEYKPCDIYTNTEPSVERVS